MRVDFKSLRYKNFLSAGNKFIELHLDECPTVLVTGENGSGKSTMLDALSFALFGKAHRKISKSQLVNSINGKNLVAEIEFAVGKTEYKVRRGIKPAVFEVWRDGEMIDQEAHVKDQQGWLENHVLRMNRKTFHQIVVLGSSSFVPFMQLPTQARREIIEGFLDIGIFSDMNEILKKRVSDTKAELVAAEHEVRLMEERISMLEKSRRDMKSLTDEAKAEKRERIAALEKRRDELRGECAELEKDIAALDGEAPGKRQAEANDKLGKLSAAVESIKREIKMGEKDVSFYSDNDECPTCLQSITEEFRKERIAAAVAELEKMKDALGKAGELEKDIAAECDEWNALAARVAGLSGELSNKRALAEQAEADCGEAVRDLESHGNSADKIEETDKLMDATACELDAGIARRDEITERRAYQDATSSLLKDGGIKSKIINQYIPVINERVNHYLNVLDFFVSFKLDGEFNERILSRHRDSFSYDSFSEGEKQRIDLALLFMWRDVAQMKNSANTNLLVLDETFDSSLDDEGVDNLMNIIHGIGQGANIFVISHKQGLEDARFGNKLEFKKEKGFSKIS